jgi:hypothetical protein
LGSRQEVLNVLLAQLLQERGLVAAPEQILRHPTGEIKLPDVLVDFQGLRLVIEAEFANVPGARERAYNKAQQRVEQGIAHIGVAVLYPPGLKGQAYEQLKSELATAKMQFAVLTEVSITPFPQLELFEVSDKAPWFPGNIEQLIESLGRCYDQLVNDETLTHAVALVEASIEWFISALKSQPASIQRLAGLVGTGGLSPDRRSRPQGGRFTESERTAVSRICALILDNAMIFQEVLASKDSRVRSLQRFRGHSDIQSAFADHWRFILEKINYYPIFHIAREILACLSADADAAKALHSLLDTAMKIVSWRAALRHDLAGRIYHRLLKEAKYLGAYYTAIPSAALLLKLALRPDRYSVDWADPKALSQMRIADLACGTGTLLMAAADVMVDNHVRACVAGGAQPQLNALHHIMVENIIHGYDVLPSAVHLTASTLALRVPDRPINVTNLYALALGGPKHALGTLEFLDKDYANGTLFSEPEHEQIVGKRQPVRTRATIPPLDLCAMNPPFTRSVGGNLLFGNLPEAERAKMQAKLKSLVKKGKVPASITAGLGSVFVALADRHLKAGGRLCLVLPRALISGVAWEPTRRLIAYRYNLEYVIVSHEPGHWNFSENTSLSEVLVVAQKRNGGNSFFGQDTVCVNFWRQPRNAIEALSVARDLLAAKPPDLGTERGTLVLTIGDRKVGEASSMSWDELRRGAWHMPGAFAQTELIRALLHLMRGKLYLPQTGICAKVPLCPLGELGELGFDRRDMHDGFSLATGKTQYPAFWCHEAAQVTTMAQHPNMWLQPLSHAKENRPLREAKHLWKKAGQLLIAERLRLNTMHLSALLVQEKVLANVWWSFVLAKKARVKDVQKALVLWLNSTLGFLLLLGHREETEGAWVDFKKPTLEAMPVLNIEQASPRQIKSLAAAYDELAQKKLCPFQEMQTDPVRAAIDKAITQTLQLPDLSNLRQLLAREPIVCLTLGRLLGGTASRA